MSSPSSNKSRRQTVGDVRELYACSTPITDKARRFTINTTISDIATNSSSSTHMQRVRTFGIKRKSPKKRRKGLRARRIIELKKQAGLNGSDSDWETKSEASIKEVNESSKNVTPKRISRRQSSEKENLDKSIEAIRDARIVHQNLFKEDLALIRSTRKTYTVRKDRSIEEHAERLPLKDVPCMIQRGIEDTEEPEKEDLEPRLHRLDGCRTYPAPIKQKQWRPTFLLGIGRRNIKSDAMKDIKIRFDTATSDMLWENFVRENPDTVGKYLADKDKKLSKKVKWFKFRGLKRRSIQEDDRNNGEEESPKKMKGKGKEMLKRKPSKTVQVVSGPATYAFREYKEYQVFSERTGKGKDSEPSHLRIKSQKVLTNVTFNKIGVNWSIKKKR